MVWTTFWDMHSGGSTKTDYDLIFIEAPMTEAIEIFEEKFNQYPHDVACQCCGENFSISSDKNLAQATGFHRRGEYQYHDKDGNIIPKDKAWVMGRGTIAEVCWEGYVDVEDTIPLEEYIKREDVLVIRQNRD